MKPVLLIHWKAAEAKERLEKIRKAGYKVVHRDLSDMEALRSVKNDIPSAIVIDLSRLPSHGREVAMFFRQQKATRHVPLIFVDGEPGKVDKIRDLLPDAVYTVWRRIGSSLKRAMSDPPESPVYPKSMFDAYEGTPLTKKLGISADTKVALIDAPPDFEKTLGKLPKGVLLKRQYRGNFDTVISFCRSTYDLKKKLKKNIALLSERGGLWIAWPKKISGVKSDLGQTGVREIGLAAGLVDYKICSIDPTWSALRFVRRK